MRGRAYRNYLKVMLGDARHDVLFVGYQAQGMPGQIIQQCDPKGGYVELDGERYDVRAGITSIGGYSAHADQKALVEFMTGMQEWPIKIRVVHGEEKAKKALTAPLLRRYRCKELFADIAYGGVAAKPEQDRLDDI